MRRSAVLILLALLAACGGPRRPARVAPIVLPPPPAVIDTTPPPPPAIVANQSVWTRDAGTLLRGETDGVRLPFIFMRLEVLRADTADLLVRCVHCPGAPQGWIGRESVVHHVRRPDQVRKMDLAEFVLAVRDAASQQDTSRLRAAMSREFVHTLGPLEMGLLETFAAWEREGFRSIDRLPFILDRGVATVTGTPVWAAPPEYASQLGYQDLRAGFRRATDGGWEWIFLVRDGM
ncbi:hypothetical protein [Longimicrobium sp.]|uniref:hypothetical protein n=1 Tax=Longimicrobium sp. TaxID=2029185 RepID=UPI003B3AEED0